MDELLQRFSTEATALSAILALATVFLWRELVKERSDRIEEMKQILPLMEKCLTTLIDFEKSLSTQTSVIENLVQKIGQK